jgi:HK97 gp10 family phage protein
MPPLKYRKQKAMAKLFSNLTKIAEAAPDVAKEAAVETAYDIIAVSQQLVPVDTGHLKSSAGVDDVDAHVVRVGYEAEYAPFVEFGTSQSAAQPFLIPAFAQSEDTFRKRLAEAIEDALNK